MVTVTKIAGGAELDRRLRAVDRKLAGKIVRKALREGAKPVAKEARSLAPRKTGQMAGAIKVRAGRSRKGVVSVVVQLGRRFFKGDSFYGAFVEFGYRKVRSFLSRKTGRWVSLATTAQKSLRGSRRPKAFDKGEWQRAGEAIRSRASSARKLIPGVHFIERAFDRRKQDALRIIIETTRTELDKAARGADGGGGGTDA